MKKGRGRYIFCGVMLAAVFLLYIGRLAQWQLLEGSTFEEDAVQSSATYLKLTGTRGEILDCNGNVLAGNRSVYNAIYSRLSGSNETRNAVVLEAVKLLETLNVPWTDRLPIEIKSGKYQFKTQMTAEIETLKSEDILDLPSSATADECMESLIERYDLEAYTSPEDIRRIASVRYGMERAYFSRTNPFVLAKDISIETVELLSERSTDLPGIETQVEQTREYPEGDLAPHIVGTLGAISQEQYDAAEEAGDTYSASNVSGYSYTDTVGQSGIESVFESTLRGKNGKESVTTDATGKVTSTTVTEPPEAGDSVWLTIDSNVQRAAVNALAEQIEAKPTEDCEAGAVVALDVNTGGIIAGATYPNFDLVALAALEEGVITPTSHPVNCDGAYHYYAPDYEPGCLGVHGEVDVYGAIRNSCNAFFFDVGRMLTIHKMHTYAELFALGEKTGCELSESAGIMSDPKTYTERHGANWYDGLTIQAAIGQCDDMFTPIELAEYCAMIANGGTRYKTHFLNKVTDYDRAVEKETAEPEVVLKAEIEDEYFKVVREGTAASTFSDFGIAVAGKTGTAENADHSDNLTFIGFAPYENPEIAVAVVIEYGGKGDAAKETAKAVFEAYFAETLQKEAKNAEATVTEGTE